jgi:hypothetical protein
MTGQEWFTKGRLRNLVDEDRIWCVRGLVGGDTLHRVYKVKATHSSPISSGSRIIFFANFDRLGEAKGAVKIKDRDAIGPLTWMPHDYLITVGPQSIAVREGEYEGEAKVEDWEVEKCYKARQKDN